MVYSNLIATGAGMTRTIFIIAQFRQLWDATPHGEGIIKIIYPMTGLPSL